MGPLNINSHTHTYMYDSETLTIYICDHNLSKDMSRIQMRDIYMLLGADSDFF